MIGDDQVARKILAHLRLPESPAAPSPSRAGSADERGWSIVSARGVGGEIPAACVELPSRRVPDHDVTLDAFFIDRTEVTQGDYDACVAAGVCTPPAMGFDPPGHPDHPANDVTWDQAAAYCAWRGKRLPTEAEWERAARGTDRRLYPWSNDPPDCARLNFSAAWPTTTCAGAPLAVATHPTGRSAVGADDMGGNVWEWTRDWYGAGYYAQSPPVNPQGPSTGTYRAKRGGSWGDPADRVRASRRWFHYAWQAESDIGFRCVR
jgi:formylglycine-generating enzyme required for sulfatase activity